MIAASDPQVKEAARMFRARITNVLVGCGVGLFLLVVGGSSEWKLPFALATTVLVSTYLVRIPTMWRQAPITAAIVVASGLTQHSKRTGLEHGLHKVADSVLLGCPVIGTGRQLSDVTGQTGRYPTLRRNRWLERTFRQAGPCVAHTLSSGEQ